jgi:hypothetical protein
MCNDYRFLTNGATLFEDFSEIKIKISFSEGKPNLEARDDIMLLGRYMFVPAFRAAERRDAERREALANTPEGRAQAAWDRMMAKALDALGHDAVLALIKTGQAPSRPEPEKATAEMIARSLAKMEGRLVDLPVSPAARAILAADAKRRGETEPGSKL